MTQQPSDGTRPSARRSRTSGTTQASRSPLSKVRPIGPSSEPELILDFDIETVAAGFADPQWVPQKVTCVAWSWVDSGRIESRICGAEGLYYEPERRARIIEELFELIDRADMVTGHNLIRFDLPVLNADAMRLGLDPIREVLVQDTMRLPKSKGFKKGQDALGGLYETKQQKLALDWEAWDRAYGVRGWPVVRERAESDVRMHMEIREGLIADGLLKKPVWWRS